MQKMKQSACLCMVVYLTTAAGGAAWAESNLAAKEALIWAVKFFHQHVATHGGYVYQYSADLSLREAEGIPERHTIWVQPPGTPSVGAAMLDAYQATGDAACPAGALDAARALARGQLHSGGWDYSIRFGDSTSAPFRRRDAQGNLTSDPIPVAERTAAGGWPLWRQRRFKLNVSTYDDDVTFAALRFLVRMDAALNFGDAEIHDAARYGLSALLGTQYPNGGWSTNFDRYPARPPDAAAFPVLRASFPSSWSRAWTKDFTGCYVTNDELMARAMETLLLASATYHEARFMEAARRAGRFLLDAQLPEPQPAWAQQYDVRMQPVWGRAFEPPAITSRESQNILRALLSLHRATGDAQYLAPVPRALAYLRRSLRPDGKLARFYELKTNRPLYFTRGPGGQGHSLTYSDQKLASNYGFIITPELDDIEAEYRAALDGTPPTKVSPSAANSAADVKRIIAALDARGAWIEPGVIRNADGRKQEPPGGIIRSETFARNVRTLCRYLAARKT